MTLQATTSPFPMFMDRAGAPLTGGKIYIGTAGANPITNPISVYYDAALTAPAAQPIRTSGGYALNGSSIARLFVDAAAFSILVRDANDVLIYSALSATNIPSPTTLASTYVEYATTAAETAASLTPTDKTRIPQFDEPRRLGAVIDDSTNDGPVLQSLEDLGGTTSLYPGAYTVRPTNTSPFDFANQTADAYRAVDLDASGYTVVGFGATFHIRSHTSGLLGGDIQFVYATDKNTTIAQNRITFVGTSFDSGNDADATNSNHRFAYMTGVRGLRYLLTEGRSSEARRGYTSHIQNCEDVQIVGHRHYKQTGGFNLRYVDNAVIVGGVHRDFSECLDFDGTSRGCVVVGNGYVSTSRSNQMWDINGQRDGVFMGATCNTLGNIATINFKDTTPDNFTDYLNNAAVTTMLPSQRVLISGVAGSAIGGGGGSATIGIGNDWAGLPHDGFDPVSDIVIRDVLLKDCHWWPVFEGRRIVLDTIHLSDMTTPAANYAFDLKSQFGSVAQRQWSGLDISVRNVHIDGCERGGIKVNGASRAEIIGCKISRINTSGSTDYAIQINNMAQRGCQIAIDHCDIDGDVNLSANVAGIAAWTITTVYVRGDVVRNGTRYYRATSSTGTSAGAGGPTGITSPITDGTVTWEYLPEPVRCTWGLNNRVRGQIIFTTDAHLYTHGVPLSVPIGTLAATGAVEQTLFVARRKCYIPRMTFTAAAAVAASGVDYRTLTTRSIRNGVDAAIATPDTQAGLSAHTPYDGGFTANEADAWLEPGDVVYFKSTSAGAGKAITLLVAHFEVLYC